MRPHSFENRSRVSKIAAGLLFIKYRPWPRIQSSLRPGMSFKILFRRNILPTFDTRKKLTLPSNKDKITTSHDMLQQMQLKNNWSRVLLKSQIIIYAVLWLERIGDLLRVKKWLNSTATSLAVELQFVVARMISHIAISGQTDTSGDSQCNLFISDSF